MPKDAPKANVRLSRVTVIEVLSGPRKGDRVTLLGSSLNIGSSRDADLCVRDAGLEAFHAVIFEQDDAFWVLDHSLNGDVTVTSPPSAESAARGPREERDARTQRLYTGDMVAMGGIVLHFTTITRVQPQKPQKPSQRARNVGPSPPRKPPPRGGPQRKPPLEGLRIPRSPKPVQQVPRTPKPKRPQPAEAPPQKPATAPPPVEPVVEPAIEPMPRGKSTGGWNQPFPAAGNWDEPSGGYPLPPEPDTESTALAPTGAMAPPSPSALSTHVEPDAVVPSTAMAREEWETQWNEGNAALTYLFAPDSEPAARIRRLRDRLLAGDAEIGPPRSILITAATRGEGASFLATNLALAFGQSVDSGALLVDADVREPDIHGHVEVVAEPGLMEHLRGDVELGDAIKRTPLPKLDVIPAGTAWGEQVELLSSRRMLRVLSDLRDLDPHRVVIVNAAPIVSAPEVASLARYVDGVLLVVGAGRATTSEVREAARSIPEERMLGVVLNNPGELVREDDEEDDKGRGRWPWQRLKR